MSAGPLFVDDGYVPRARGVVVVVFLKKRSQHPGTQSQVAEVLRRRRF